MYCSRNDKIQTIHQIQYYVLRDRVTWIACYIMKRKHIRFQIIPENSLGFYVKVQIRSQKRGISFLQPIARKKTNPNGLVFFLIQGSRVRTHSSAICRWHIASTSANTGRYLNFRHRRKCKSNPSFLTKCCGLKRCRTERL